MSTLPAPTQPQHLVVVVGGAVAGSEAAALSARRGALTVVLEQGDRPYGKIEDGLPRWHEKLRRKEYERIRDNLTEPGVVYVPRTALGRDVTLPELLNEWQASAVLLACGAWRDRPLPVEGVDAYVDRGLVYQNALVHWYNHYPEEGYEGPQLDIPQGPIVIGGGLASIDVVKIINLQLYKAALAERGIQVTTLELEHAGIPATLAKHDLHPDQLGVRGATLFYRRSKREMPLASPPPNATAAQRAKIGDVREKLMDKVIDKYLVQFEGNHAPLEAITDGERLYGLRFQRTHTVDGKLVPIAGDTVDVEAPLVVSSIGSIPLPMPDLPMKGELIDFADWETGLVRGYTNVFGLGNALTGKGNIKDSRQNADLITTTVLERYLGVGTEELGNDEPPTRLDAARTAERALEVILSRTPLEPDQQRRVQDAITAHWERAGYTGDFDRWVEDTSPRGHE